MDNLYNKAHVKTCGFLVQTIERKYKFSKFNLISYWKIEQKMTFIDTLQDAIKREIREKFTNEN
jgi:hypothetical protein